ncbi:hypothetical protein [Pseudonocardia nematodicida]
MLTNAEARTLYDIASLADMVAELNAAWRAAGSPMTTKGSRGQEVTHPLITELRFHRQEMASMAARLRLEKLSAEPDVSPAGRSGPMSRTDSARTAARARWHPAKGA